MSETKKKQDPSSEENEKQCVKMKKMVVPGTSCHKRSSSLLGKQKKISDFMHPKKKPHLSEDNELILCEAGTQLLPSSYTLGETVTSISSSTVSVPPSDHVVLNLDAPITSTTPVPFAVPGPSTTPVPANVKHTPCHNLLNSNEGKACYDIGYYIGSAKIDDVTKMNLLENHWIPPSNYDFPYSTRNYCGKIIKNFVRASHLDNYKDWLVLSDIKKGLFCKYCPLFTNRNEGGYCKNVPLKTLVTEPLKNFKKLTGSHGDLETHCNAQYHKNSVQAGNDFLRRFHSPNLEICNIVSNERLKQANENRIKLIPIVKTIIFSGRQNIPLRGHRDDGNLSTDPAYAAGEGNFKALLRFRIDSGDTVLQSHLESVSSRATYLSKTTQNAIIECCKQEITEVILTRVSEAQLYSIIFDETSDLSHKSQISLVLRYLFYDTDGDIHIKEDFLTFIDAFQSLSSAEVIEDDADENDVNELTLTGENLGKIIVRTMFEAHLPISKCIGITTDGCSVMMSSECGAVKEIQKEAVNAITTPCYSHKLNISISKSSKVAVIDKTVSVMKEVISFFSYPKRDVALRQFLGKKLVKLCETRWTERHDGVIQFTVSLPGIANALEKLSQWKDKQTAGKASILLGALTETQFIMGLFCLSDVLSSTLSLSLILQKDNLDVAKATTLISNLLKTLEDQRKDAEKYFHEVFVNAEAMADKLGVELIKPRICGRQTKRDNYQVDSVEEFYRLSVYIPLLENIILDMKQRFSPEVMDILNIPLILPESVVNAEDILELNRTLKTVVDRFEHVLEGSRENNYFRLKAELCQWRNHWKAKQDIGEELPTKALHVLRECDKNIFPLLNSLLRILCTLPVSNASSERSFSTLRLIKTYLRSTMSENRLIGLALLNIHKDIYVDPLKVIDRFAKSGSHRIVL